MLRNKNANLTKFIYDLNIFQREELDVNGEYKHMGPWYIHIYEYDEGNIFEISDPIEMTQEEYNSIIKDDPYFNHDPDLWYGLEGFMFEKWKSMSDRLKSIFESLPKYREEVLF